MTRPLMTVRAKWTGIPELKGKLKELTPAVERGRDNGLVGWALMVQNRARQLIQKSPRGGRLYKRRGVVRRASAPGEPPATDTGNLVRNIVADPKPERGSISIVSRAAYSFFLQLGTRFMRPRPFLDRALRETEDQGQRFLKASIRKEIDNVIS